MPRALRTVRALLLLLLAAGACQPAPQPAVLPTPRIMTVQVSPTLTIFAEQFQACAEEMPEIGLVVLERPAGAFDPEQSKIALRWGAGNMPEGYAAVIGEEALVLVVHPDNPLDQIRLEDARAIYQGTLRDWQEPAPPAEIQAWAYPAGDDAQAVFENALLDGAPAAQRVVYLAPDPAAMREAIAANPAAIGFLPARWVDGSVKALPVAGLEPERLRQPLLAVSEAEPRHPEKSWLICLQEQRK